MDCSLPGSPLPGILQARTLEWVAISFSNAWKWSRSVVSNSLQPHGLQPTRLLCPWDFPGKSAGVGCHCLLHIPSWDNPKVNNGPWVIIRCQYRFISCSSPGSSDHGILQARILEWIAISSSRGSFQPREQTRSPESPALARGFYTAEPPGKSLV